MAVDCGPVGFPKVDLQVFAVGTKVTLDSDIIGMVTGIAIYSDSRIQYQVAWWNGRSRSCEWLEACEVNPCESYKVTCVGFGK